MAAPAAVTGASLAWRNRGLLRWVLLGVVALLLLIFVAPFMILLALSGAAFSSPSPVAIADIPANYLADYQAAAARYHLDWAVLAAVGKIECDHGRSRLAGCRPFTHNSAGAVGPMQFLPPTWAVGHLIGQTRVVVRPEPDGHGYASDGDGDGRADIWNPADAIMGAARLLAANGAPADYQRALLAYNHAGWYVQRVLAQAAIYRAVLPGTGGPGGWAMQYLGTAYVWGGNHGVGLAAMQSRSPRPERARDGRTGYFDCSSLAAWSFAKARGLYIGDTTTQQWLRGTLMVGNQSGIGPPLGGLQPGDLVFFDHLAHVGIYLGGDRFIEAPHTGADVEISRFSTYPGFYGWIRWAGGTG